MSGNTESTKLTLSSFFSVLEAFMVEVLKLKPEFVTLYMSTLYTDMATTMAGILAQHVDEEKVTQISKTLDTETAKAMLEEVLANDKAKKDLFLYLRREVFQKLSRTFFLLLS